MLTYLIVCWSGQLAWATNLYASANGTNAAPPFTNWSLSCSNIQWVVNAAAAGDTVWVSNGTYYLTSRVSVAKSITVKGVTNNGIVTLDGQNITNCFYLSSAGATVDCFNIINGNAVYGGGVKLTYGTMQYCVISNNTAVQGGGVYLEYGTMQYCTISSNTATANGGGVYAVRAAGTLQYCTICNNLGGSSRGGGIYNCSGALVKNCIIVSNSALGGFGGGIYCEWGTNMNCLVAYNTAGYGGGIAQQDYAAAGTWAYYFNCTIASNTATSGGGGYYKNNEGGRLAQLNNTVIYFNQGPGSNYSISFDSFGGTTIFHNCCTAPAFTGTSTNYATNNIFVNPLFVNKDTGDFHLRMDAPCINAGTNEPWMNGAVDLDGHHRIDIFSGMVDMGCYEYLPAGSMYRGF
jgi:hypothetical protein